MPIARDETAFFETVRDNPWNRLALIEGDSWAAHPFIANLATQLEVLSRYRYNVLDLSYPGHTAQSMFGNDRAQLKDFRRVVSDARWGYDFEWILLSAGGNDIVGPEIRNFVDAKRPGAYGRELLNDEYGRIVDQQVVAGYRRVLDICAASKLNRDTPVIAHAYSYLQPRTKGTRLPVFGPHFGEGWIAQYLEAQGIEDADEQQDIIVVMLDGFYEKLSSLARSYRNLIVVDTRKILSKQGRPEVNWWSDEIHPTGEGFARVAKAIMKHVP